MKFFDLFRPKTDTVTAPRSPLAMALEPRMLFDGAVAATVAETAQADNAAQAQPDNTQDSHNGDTPDATAATPPSGSSDQRHEIVFVDSNVQNYQQLVAGVKPGTEVVVLDGDKDGLQQIADYLKGREGIDAIHILSHGDVGKVQLGSLWLDNGNMASRSELLATIGQSLDSEGDILLYGCTVGANGDGQDFIQAIASATSADVAASTNLTGARSLGGDWVLETHTGSIETSLPFEAASIDAYDAVLASPASTTTFGSGGNDDPLNTGPGDQGVTVTNIRGSGWDVTVTTETATAISIAAGDLAVGSGDGIYYSGYSDPIIGGEPLSSFKISSNDGSLFDLQQIGVSLGTDMPSVPVQLTITGYLNGAAVSGASKNFIIAIDGNSQSNGNALEFLSVAGNSYFSGIDSFVITQSNGSGKVINLAVDEISVLNVRAANAPPVISNLGGDSANYTEGAATILLDAGSNASVSDSDSADFSGGNVTVAITAGRVTTEDVLGVRNQGTGAGQIGVSGSNVTYGGVTIGTIAGGSGSNNLMITLNGSATPTAVTELLHNLTYSNSNGGDIGTGTRSVSITVNDGDGGTSTAAMVTVGITAVNDAPTLSTTGGTPTFTENGSAVGLFSGTTIDTVEAGQTIDRLTLTVTNVADGSAEVLRVDGSNVTLTNGNSVTTTTNGMTVSVSVSAGTATVVIAKIGGISGSAAATLVNGLTYSNTSDAPSTTARTITLTGIRDNGGTANGGVDSSVPGQSATVSISAVNDAPTLSGGPYTWAGTNEDTASNAVTVSSLLGSTTHADVDGPASGIAITGSTAGGTWQYSTDGSTWTDIGAVSNGAALLLSSSTQLRFVPDGQNGSAAGLTFRAWDQSAGTASTNGTRNTADTSTNGGSSAYSTGTAQATLTVSSVNDAPVLAPASPTLTGLSDSDITNPGMAVSAFATGGITDVDTGAVKGIAVTGLTSGFGTWQYSTNGGASWQDVGTVSDSAALLLLSTDRVRFVPDGVNGTVVTLTYHAWDQTGATAGQQGTKMDASVTGGSSAFSVVGNTASLTVTAVNEHPVVTVTSAAAIWTEANNAPSDRIVVDSGVTLSDPDGPNPTSATVRLLTYYSSQDSLAFVNDGLTMGNIVGTWSAGTGILTLTSAGNTATAAQFQAALRAVTYGNSSEIPNTTSRTVQFQVTDGGGLASVAVTREITIIAVNDSPTINAAASQQINEDISTALSSISFSDVDSSVGIVTFSVGGGTLSATSAGGVTVGGTATALTLSGSLANINQFIADNGLVYTPAANASGDVTLTINVNTTSVSDATTTMNLHVVAVNDAPVATVPPSITVTEDVSSVITGISFTDIDAGINAVTATFSVPSGTLSATTGLGVTVGGSGTGLLTLNGSLADINFFIAANGLTFKTAQDATASVILTVNINDRGSSGSGGELTDTKTVTLNVTAVNDAPVNNVPGAQTASQNVALGFNTANGNAISISDVDSGNGLMTVTLTAVNGTLSLGNLNGINMANGTGQNTATMTIEGSRTNINAALQSLTFKGASNYIGAASITIETNDNGNSGTGGAKTDVDIISINVIPVNPKVTNVSAQGLDRTVKIGDEVLISMTWDQVVNVDLSSGSPTLLLETGLLDRNAVYVSGTGSNTLVFKYTVQAGDISADLDFQSTAALQLNGAVITNNTSDLAVLTLPTVGGADSLGGRSNIVVDGVAPMVNSVSVPANGTYGAGQSLDFTVNFSEAIIVDTNGGTPRLAVMLDGGGLVYADYLSGSGSNALVFSLTISSGQFDNNGISLGGSIDINGGALKDTAGNDAVTILNSVAATNAVLVDATGPEAGIALDGASPTNASTLSFTVTFNEDVTGVDLADFGLVASGTASGTLQSLVQLDARTYRITVGGVSGQGNLGLALTANGSGISDAAGNAMVDSVSTTGYVIGGVTTGDPEFRSTTPGITLELPTTPLQPLVPDITTSTGSPLLPPPLFEVRTVGGDLAPLGTIFLGHGAQAPSFIAQVFGSSDSGISGSGTGFLGFGGSDNGVFGSSTFASIFGREAPGVSEIDAFNGSQWNHSDLNQGIRGVFGVPTFGQQLHQLHEAEQQPQRELAWALGELAQSKASV